MSILSYHISYERGRKSSGLLVVVYPTRPLISPEGFEFSAGSLKAVLIPNPGTPDKGGSGGHA